MSFCRFVCCYALLSVLCCVYVDLVWCLEKAVFYLFLEKCLACLQPINFKSRVTFHFLHSRHFARSCDLDFLSASSSEDIFILSSKTSVKMAAAQKVFHLPELMGIISKSLSKKDICRLRAVNRDAERNTWHIFRTYFRAKAFAFTTPGLKRLWENSHNARSACEIRVYQILSHESQLPP